MFEGDLEEGELEIGQIVRFPKASRDAEEYCVDQLKEFKLQLESGKKEMKTLAALYSDDPGSKDKSGQYEINRNEKQWDPVFMAKAFSLKEGQISSPFKSKFGYHIIQMVSRAGDDATVRHILKIPQVTKTELSEAILKLDQQKDKLEKADSIQDISEIRSKAFTYKEKEPLTDIKEENNDEPEFVQLSLFSTDI
jgi:peptidyl-prolyl cis-trans isomerase SurA